LRISGVALTGTPHQFLPDWTAALARSFFLWIRLEFFAFNLNQYSLSLNQQDADLKRKYRYMMLY